MFEGFTTARVETLRPHDRPETSAKWHKMAPGLAERFTVICPELRPYGRIAKPAAREGHYGHSKVRGKALPCRHFLPEEGPAETLAARLAFLGA